MSRNAENTSGKILWWLVFTALYSTNILPKFTWGLTFDYYFSNAYRYDNADHPIREMARKL